MFGISGSEFLVLAVIAALVLGPKNVAQALTGLRHLLASIQAWSAKMRRESSGDFSALTPEDLENLKMLRNINFSRYNPKQMIRQTIQEELDAWTQAASDSGQALKNSVSPKPGDTVEVEGADYSK